MDYSLLLEDDNLDASPSEPLEITLPKNQDGKLFIGFDIFCTKSILILHESNFSSSICTKHYGSVYDSNSRNFTASK